MSLTREQMYDTAWSVLMPPGSPRHHPDCPALTGGECACWAATITGRIKAVLDVLEPEIRASEREALRIEFRDLNSKLEWHVGEYGDGFRTAIFAVMSLLGERET